MIVVGDVTTDIVAVLDQQLAIGSDTPTRIQLSSGGQGANVASWLAWLGTPVTFVASVGDDAFGQGRLVELSQNGVDCAFQWCRQASTGTVVILSEGSERSMLTDRGANRCLEAGEVTAAIASSPEPAHLHLSGYVLLDQLSRPAGLAALAAARARGLTVSLDASSIAPIQQVSVEVCRQWLGLVDLLLANSDEAALLAGRPSVDAATAARRLIEYVPATIVKAGADGAVWADRTGASIHAAAVSTAAIDTTGAGDAFAAGFLASYLTDRSVSAALSAGCRCGAIAVSRVGSAPPSTLSPFDRVE